MMDYEFSKRDLLFLESLIVLIAIIVYNIYFIYNKTNEIYKIDYNIFNINKEKAELDEEKYPFLIINKNFKKDINLNNQNNNIIVGIDFGTSNTGFSFIIGNDMKNLNLNKKTPSEFGLSQKTNKAIHYSFASAVSMMNYRKNELNNIIYIKGMKSIFYSNNYNYSNNIFYIYPTSNIKELNIVDALKEYFLMLKCDIIKEIENYCEIDEDKKMSDEIEEKIIWIVSIPSTWNEFEKQLFKNSINKSGMINNKFLYESEATSLAIYYDRYIPEKIKKKNKKFMIVDAGAYSVDITVNEIIDKKGSFKEIVNTTSLYFGIYSIIEEIIKILGNYVDIKKIKNNDPGEWIKTLRDINKAIENTYCLDGIEIFEINFRSKDIKPKKYFYSYKNNKYIIEFNEFSLFLPADLIGIMILNNINIIKRNIEDLIQKLILKKIKLDSIIFTGGFSQNKIFKSEMEHYFHKNNKIDIEFLISYQTSISKGAVLYGMNSDRIQIRTMPITIGIRINDKINILIKKGEEIKNPFAVKYIKPILENQKIIQVNIYTSNVEIVNDNELENHFLGRLLLKLNNKNQGIIELIFKYEICLEFLAINYDNGQEISTEFQYFKENM